MKWVARRTRVLLQEGEPARKLTLSLAAARGERERTSPADGRIVRSGLSDSSELDGGLPGVAIARGERERISPVDGRSGRSGLSNSSEPGGGLPGGSPYRPLARTSPTRLEPNEGSGCRPETPTSSKTLRYEPDEKPPHALSFGLGFQHAALCIAGVVLTPVIVIRAAGGGEPYLSWAIFAALAVSGLTTVLQAYGSGASAPDTSSSWAPPGPSSRCA